MRKNISISTSVSFWKQWNGTNVWPDIWKSDSRRKHLIMEKCMYCIFNIYMITDTCMLTLKFLFVTLLEYITVRIKWAWYNCVTDQTKMMQTLVDLKMCEVQLFANGTHPVNPPPPNTNTAHPLTSHGCCRMFCDTRAAAKYPHYQY